MNAFQLCITVQNERVCHLGGVSGGGFAVSASSLMSATGPGGRAVAEELAEENVQAAMHPVVYEDWEDVTSLFSAAAAEMHVGEMIHTEQFSLYSAMSAIELMQPKMDVGCGEVRNVTDVNLPPRLCDRQVISIMDELLACTATWMQAHTLPQTVFSCVYTQRINEIPRPELEAFIRVLLATMSLVRTIVTTEQVFMEEDFITYNFGFKLPVLTEQTIAKIVREAVKNLNEPGSASPAAAQARRCMGARLKFLQAFHSCLSSLTARDCRRFSQGEIYVEFANAQLKVVEESWRQYEDSDVSFLFDSTFNRHLLANTPPRTAPVLTREKAFAVWFRSVDELRALTIVKPMLLPSAPVPGETVQDTSHSNDNPPPGSPAGYYSFHNLLHALGSFSAKWNASILTRSVLKRLLLPAARAQAEVAVFGIAGCTLPALLLADMGVTIETGSAEVKEQVAELSSTAARVVWGFLRNRGRQRRYLLRSLLDWDRAVLAITSTRNPSISPSTEGQDTGPVQAEGNRVSGDLAVESESLKSQSRTSNIVAKPAAPRDMFEGKSPLQLMAHEVSARLMMHHWLLGFECQLYQPREYAPVFFYIGYVATTSANATAALATCGAPSAELHPCRYALYLMDEARLWICRATFSLLEALELGSIWQYSWRGSRKYSSSPRNIPQENGQDSQSQSRQTASKSDAALPLESDELRYEQRFGKMGRLLTGPQFMSYTTFLTLLKLQRDSLMSRNSDSSDEIAVRLADAASGFKVAREALERAQRAAKACAWEPLIEETLQLARVAVSNSILITKLKKSHGETLEKFSQSLACEERPCTVSFTFKQHRHFPVISVGGA